MSNRLEQVSMPIRANLPVVHIAVELILFATIGFTGLQLLATAGTTSFQPTVVVIAILVVSVMAALAVALDFVRRIRA